MPRLTVIDPATAEGEARELLQVVEKKMKRVPNMTRVMANSPALLKSYLAMSDALAHGSFSTKLRERIALLCAQFNRCEYCVSAHTAIGKMVGLSDADLADAREGKAADPRDAAVLQLAQAMVQHRGHVTDAQLQAARAAGLTDTQIAEVVGVVTLNILTNYINHLADTEIDFPKVELTCASAAGSCCG